METIQRDYAPRGVRFYYIYKSLAHPEHNGYVTPFTLQERLQHVKEAQRTLGSRFTWICDTMENDLKHALGDAPNSEFVIDPEGKVARRRSWSHPSDLRRDLEELVGPVENPTRIQDLDLKTAPPPEKVASGIVPRIELPGRWQALKIEPVSSADQYPFYVKLRAEATPEVLRGDPGRLYLGFHLDPLYHVHWNNLVDPLEFEITAPEGVTVSPRQHKAAKVEEPADSDPREFLVDVRKAGTASETIEVTVRYYACDNANTFCVPVKQQYLVHLRQDPDGGRVQRRGGGFGRPGGFAGFDFRSRMLEQDRDGDGRLSREEAPERMLERFDRMDANGDGFIDAQEMESMRPPFAPGSGGFAGDRGARSGNEPAPRPSPLAAALDADEDGVISRREMARAARALRQLDKNRDGQLTREEYEPVRPAPESGGRFSNRSFPGPPGGFRPEEMMRQRFKESDANGDGKLSREEASGPMSQRFHEMDENEDGVVDRNEMEQAIERMRNRPAPGRPGPNR